MNRKNSKKISFFVFLCLAVTFLLSCIEQRVFLHPSESPASLRRVAVVPFEDLSVRGNASRVASANFLTELRKFSSFQVLSLMHPEEGALPLAADSSGSKKSTFRDASGGLTTEDYLALAVKAGADGVVTGKITEYKYKRGLGEEPVLGLNVQLTSLKDGTVLWNSSISVNSGFFQLGEASLSRLSQEASIALVRSMFAK